MFILESLVLMFFGISLIYLVPITFIFIGSVYEIATGQRNKGR